MLTRRPLAITLAFAAVLGAATLLASPGGAASTPRGGAFGTMAVNPSTVTQGESATLTGNGCFASDVDIQIANADHSVHITHSLTAAADGTWAYVIDTTSMPPDVYDIDATCAGSAPAGQVAGRQVQGFTYATVQLTVVAQQTSSSTTTTTTVPGSTTTTAPAPAPAAQPVQTAARFTG